MSLLLSPASILSAGIKPSRAVAYYRCAAETSHAHALASQYRPILAWANQQGVDIIHEFVDCQHSAAALSTQPALTELLDWVQRRSDFTFILCHDESRWSRNREQLETLLAACAEYGKRVIFTANSTAGVST